MPDNFTAAIALASVGVLYALHRLRAEPRQRPTATLLFWRQALGSQQARALSMRRFSHWKTFLLLALILLLLTAGMSADRWGRIGSASRDMIVIDDGADTSAPDASGRTLLRALADDATADLSHMAPGPGLIVAARSPLLIVQPDQPACICARALAQLSPQQGASASVLALHAAGVAQSGTASNRQGQIHWYTPRVTVPAGLPLDIARRIVVHHVRTFDSVAITGVTFEPAPDPSSDGVLRVQVSGTAPTAMSLQARTVDGADVTQPVTMARNTDGSAHADLTFAHWPADGQPVHLMLINAPGAPVAHTMEFRVPDHRPLVFRFEPGVPLSLRLALLTAGVEATKDARTDKVIFVASIGTPVPLDCAAAILISNDGAGVASGTPLRLGDTPLIQGLGLEAAVTASGPALDAAGTPILIAGAATVATLNLSDHCPTLMLSSAIVSQTAGLPRHAVFPVLLKRLCDALTGRSEMPAVISASRVAADPLWAGPPGLPAAHITAVPDVPPAALTVDAKPPMHGGRWNFVWSEVELAVALTLLVTESLLHVTRKIV